MSSRYIVDKDDLRIKKDKPSGKTRFLIILKYFAASVTLAIIYYVIFALVFSTDTERRLKQENRMYEKLYPEMQEKEKLLGDVVGELKSRDNSISEEIFHSGSVYSIVDFGYADFVAGSDSVTDEGIERYTEARLADAKRSAANVEKTLQYIIEKCAALDDSVPPMHLPVKDFSYTMIGASAGSKISPFYRVSVSHDGLDMIVQTGTPIYAPSRGVVTKTDRSQSGQGNVVEIDHGNGYVTRYAHLKEIHVRVGRQVERGDRIGLSGTSGRAFAPHLHYSIKKDTLVLNPLNYFFGSVSPHEYVEMMILGEGIAQSLD